MNGPIIRYAKAADGVDIGYGEFPGEGTPIVVVPKFGQMNVSGVHKLRSLVDFYNALRCGAPTFIFDFRGNGLSGALQGKPSVEQYTLDLAAVMDVAGQAVDLVAYQGGCHAAARFAVEHPERVRSLAMVCPLPNALLDVRFYSRVMNDDYWMGPTLALRYAFDIAPDEPVNDLVAEFERSYRGSTIDLLSDPAINFSVSVAEDLRRVQAPVLVIGPEDDRHWPEARETAALHPGATHWKTPVIRYNADFGQRMRTRMDALLGHTSSPPAGAAVREALEGMHPTAAPGEPARRNGHLPAMSDRELQVLALLATGCTSEAIAADLTLSTRTVERHVQNIYNKLGVHNRVEAANWVARNGLPW